MKKMFTGILASILLLFMAACTGTTQEKEYPEHYEQYSALLGESREAALTQLNLTEQDLVPGQKGMYSIPVTAQFSGLTFDVALEFDVTNDRLYGFVYTTDWNGQWIDDQWATLVQDLGALTGTLNHTFGTAQKTHFSQKTQEELMVTFGLHDRLTGLDQWLVEQREDALTQDYVALLRERLGAQRPIADHLNLTLQLQVNADRPSDSALARLFFRLEPNHISQEISK